MRRKPWRKSNLYQVSQSRCLSGWISKDFASDLLRRMLRGFCSLLTVLATCSNLARGDGATNRVVHADIEYARIGDQILKLDLHIPSGKAFSPLIVWVHGGAWRSGSKKNVSLGKLVEDGYPIASVDYRLSTQAKFPAQVHDIKAAIRFLRAHGSEWGLATGKIAIAGDSAGGHLAALVGVSNQHPELEGEVGSDRGQSSDVQAILSFYGAANLTTILKQSTPRGLEVRVPALGLLLGGQPMDVPALARLASPVFHVDANDPPLLLLHGDQDPQMPVNQSLELWGAYRKADAPVQLEVVHGAGHGGAIFYDAEHLTMVKKFLRRYF
jgi:acetyl esterase/lipase